MPISVPLRSGKPKISERVLKNMRKNSDHDRSPFPLAAIVRQELASIRSSRKLLVAVSGGADSVALLHLLLEAGYRHLIVAHFNHCLRGAASTSDAIFVRKLASRLSLQFETGSGDVRKIAREQKLSLETAARQARYSFLGASARKHRVRSLLLAHHADDQLETCLFNFLRGSGAAGLAGMKPTSNRSIEGLPLILHRPLLKVSKKELLAYLKNCRLPYREDLSNRIAVASRNKLRLKVIPLIEECFGPSFRESIVRNSSIFAHEEDFLAGMANPMALQEHLPVKILQKLHPALRRRVLHSWLKNNDILDPGFAEVERTTLMLTEGGPAKINLPGNRHARRRSGVIFIE